MSNNPTGNPDIQQHAIGHRFGEAEGADPRAAQQKSKPWSIRAMAKRICAAEFDVGPNAPSIEEQIKTLFGGKMTGGQLAAVRKFAQAMKDPRAMDTLIDNVDGKLIEKKIEATATLADIVGKSYDGEFLNGSSEESGE